MTSTQHAIRCCAIFALVGSAALAMAAPGDPDLTIWYGSEQTFGNNGTPQQWINILGNVADTNGLSDLTYQLNGAPPVSLRPKYDTVNDLSIGPDGRRLLEPGDFNVELDKADLLSGANELIITATDNTLATSQTTVTVNYDPSTYWPETYNVTWSAVSDIQQAVQIVDGQWTLDSNGLRPVVMGYDRVIDLGDLNWDDYEVTVPLTLHAIDSNGFTYLSGSPGFGMTFRWNGHVPGSQDPDAQPRYYWWPAGGGVWYDAGHDGPLSIGTWAGSLDVVDTSGFQIAYDTAYIFKFRVETILGTGSQYSLKVWPAGDTEPAEWYLTGTEVALDVPYGSCIFVAHHVDLTIGDIQVVPLPDPNPPIISDVLTIPTDTNAMISWTTNEPATSKVEYGPTQAYEDGAVEDLTLVRQHVVVLNNLTTDQLYHYRVSSTDVDSNGASTGDRMFIAQNDTGPPMISSVGVTVTDTTANITWVTNEPATSVIEYWADGIDTNSVSHAPYVMNHWVHLTDLQTETLYSFRVGGADVLGHYASTSGFSFTTLDNIFDSDSFDTCPLDETRWTFIDPFADSHYELTGNEAKIVIGVTGNNHDIWTSGNTAPRLSQAIPNGDFSVEVKFDSPLTAGFQSQGILIEEDAPDVRVIRAEFHIFNGITKFYAATIFGQTVQVKASRTLALSTPMWIQVTRAGDFWTIKYRFATGGWQSAANFTKAMKPTDVSFYAGCGETDSHTAIIDYVFDVNAPISPEDDCNSNGIEDDLDIAGGTSLDIDGNGAPDECQVGCPGNALPGDCDNDGDIDLDDHVGFTECLAGPGQSPPAAATAGCRCLDAYDFDADGDVDLVDFGAFQRAFSPPPPP